MRSSRSASPSTAIWTLGIVVLLVGAGGVGWLLFGGTDKASEPPAAPTALQHANTGTEAEPEFKGQVPEAPVKKPIEIGKPYVHPREDLQPAVASTVGPNGCIEGVTLNSQNLPVEGVHLSLFQGNALLSGAFPGTRQRIDVSADSGPGGVFKICDAPVGKNYVLVGEHDDFARSEASGFSIEKDSITSGVVLRMSDGAVLHGTVSDFDSNPIAGARVELYYTLDMAWLKPEDQKPFKVVFTDPEGRYAFTHVSASSLRLRAAAQDYASESRTLSYALDVIPKEQEVNFSLVAGASLPGRVITQQGSPIPNARVEATSVAKDSQSNSIAYSDDGGYFVLDGMSHDSYQIRATAEGFSDKQLQPVDVSAGNYTIMLERRGGVSGWVTSKAGAPVTSFTLYLMKVHGPGQSNYLNESHHFEAADGHFTYDNLDPGDYVLEARCDDYADTRSDPFRIDRDSAQPTQIRILMSKGGTLTGHVLSAAGKPLADAVVSLNENNFIDSSIVKIFKAIAPSDERERKVKSDGEGRYTMAHITPGTWQVTAEHPETASLVLNDIEVRDEEAGGNNPLDLKLPLGARIDGRAVDDSSVPLPFCKVQITQKENAYMDAGTTDRDGYFSFQNLRSGNYQITINPERVRNEPIHPFLRLVYAQKSQKDVYVDEGQTVDGVLIQLKTN